MTDRVWKGNSPVTHCIPRAMYSTQGSLRFSAMKKSPSDVVTTRMWSAAGSGFGSMNVTFSRAALADQLTAAININSHQKYGLTPHKDMVYSEALRYWKCTCHHNDIHYKVSLLLVYFYADLLESYTFGFLSKQFLNGICLTWQISAWITHKRRHLCGSHLFKAVLQ